MTVADQQHGLDQLFADAVKRSAAVTTAANILRDNRATDADRDVASEFFASLPRDRSLRHGITERFILGQSQLLVAHVQIWHGDESFMRCYVVAHQVADSARRRMVDCSDITCRLCHLLD